MKKVDYCSNTVDRTFADGLDAEIFSFKILEKAYFNAKSKLREHVTGYFNGKNRRNNNNFNSSTKIHQEFKLYKIDIGY